MSDKGKIEVPEEPKDQPGVLRHLKRWKDLYEVIGILVAVVVSFLSLHESHNAIRLTEQSVQIQKKDYDVRNRPYIILDNAALGGPVTSVDGSVSPESIKLEIRNVSDIPARKVCSAGLVYVDDKEVSKTVITESARAKDTPGAQKFNIPAPYLSVLTNKNVRLHLVVTTTYFGMFEQQTPYETIARCRFYPEEKVFGQPSLEIK